VEQRSIRALVATVGIDSFEVQRGLPRDSSFELIGVVDDVDDTIRGIRSTECDILLVACTGNIDRALHVIDGAHSAEPTLPILVLAQTSPGAFLSRAFESGATDVVSFLQLYD